ncbi:protein kinase domain-containing protein, partial [Piscirickettsia salmonis]|uniref:protein kinase domain-containing protein n=1 Tax=Piscirickettsia salmonis TaxID=1238 RepID=UPI003EBDEEFA
SQGGNGSVRLFASKIGLERYAVKRPLEVQRHSLDYLKLEERLFKKVYPNAEVLFSATSNIDGRLVMPFFPGYSFNAALIKYSDRIDEIVLAVALELQRIHQNGVIHGDIRSDNIIIEEKNGIFNAKFIDFGWAYEYPSDDNVIVIKCSYFAPERAKVGIKAYPSQDIYSFGWMLGIAHDLVKEIPEKFYGFLIGANEEDPVLRPELRLLIKANLCPTLGEHYTELAIDNLDSYQLMRNMGLNKAYT